MMYFLPEFRQHGTTCLTDFGKRARRIFAINLHHKPDAWVGIKCFNLLAAGVIFCCLYCSNDSCALGVSLL